MSLHEPLGAELLHRIPLVVILSASGAFAGFGSREFVDDPVNRVSIAFHGAGDRPATEGAEPVTISVFPIPRKIHLRDRDAFALDIEPDVAFAPVQKRLHADVFARS